MLVRLFVSVPHVVHGRFFAAGLPTCRSTVFFSPKVNVEKMASFLLRYRFSAFWLRSSVVSVLISLISGMSGNARLLY